VNIDHVLIRGDDWQRRHRFIAVGYGVIKKFGDDNANQYVVGLGWYGFVAIYPLLLVVVTLFGFLGVASLGRQLVAALHQFPVVGSQFNPARGSSSLHGSVLGLAVGIAGFLYGAQGVTQIAQQAMVQVWNIPATRGSGIPASSHPQPHRIGGHRGSIRDQRGPRQFRYWRQPQPHTAIVRADRNGAGQ
jgi:uncharacterized BrkB/YihY/UPF0761 family membrane protein